MTFEKFQNMGVVLTEREIQRIEKLIIQEYKKTNKNIDSIIRKYYEKLEGVDPTEYYANMLAYDRLEKLKYEITKEYDKTAKQTRSLIFASVGVAFSNNYYRQRYTTDWLQTGAKFEPLPKDLVQLAVEGTAKRFKEMSSQSIKKFGDAKNYIPKSSTIAELVSKNRDADIEKIITQINIGLKRGDSVAVISRNIRDIVGKTQIEAGQIKSTGAMANAMRIVRTETGRVMNEASFANSFNLQSQGIEVKKMWSASLDANTRPSHASLDGQTVDVDKPFKTEVGDVMYPLSSGIAEFDINCRCTTIDIINNILPENRVGYDPESEKRETYSFKSFNEWAESKGLKKNNYGQFYN